MSDSELGAAGAPDSDLRSRIAATVRANRVSPPVLASESVAVAARHSRAAHRHRRHGRTRRRLPSGVRWAILLIGTVLSVFVLRGYVIASFYIPSASMETTLHGCQGCEPDRVLVDKLSYRLHSVHRKDVVVFAKPDSWNVPDKDLIKRVIGLPGEAVSAHGGVVYIGSVALNEPYVNPACTDGTADFGPITVPAGQYFVMGDNRCNSSDSRFNGTIPRDKLVGRAFAVVWPLKHLRWL
ncbi:signal peptidase I [Jatrophihabitans telluris]|uniref:Signal peptidase I n=1 Tax=Jatrophihabitans telluris TaxID=2038343 RepID=A0ABY4QRZ3_9ACTN|nr:signal peptidase I [Jatrophihabitans telluris]UQX86644.1 signal peptidase I [Jatrophihabitans telluris]